MIPLEQVLRPYNLEKFLQEFWRKQTLHIKRGVEGYYDDLLQPRHVEELLLHGRLRHPDVRVVQHGREDPDEELLNAGWFDKAGSEQSTENLATLYGFYEDGFTLMVEAQRVSSGIFELCRQMEEWLQHPVVAKIFLTPRGSQSFPVHYDTSDSFILQVSGAKRWRLYPISQEKPTATLSERVRRKAWNVSGAPVFDQTLQPGDLLYIPRLQPHEVVTKTDDSSLHVTIGITPFYWRDLMICSLEELMDRHPRFNETLPAQFFRRARTKCLKPRTSFGFGPSKMRTRGAQWLAWELSFVRGCVPSLVTNSHRLTALHPSLWIQPCNEDPECSVTLSLTARP
jgi:ribosomal protein L16 Arg81 hydroxylase